MRPRNRPADMTFTEEELYDDRYGVGEFLADPSLETPPQSDYMAPLGDPWDASNEPDAFSPLEMIQPDAEDVSAIDEPDLDAWIDRTAEPPSTVDASGIDPLPTATVYAPDIAPMADASPAANRMRKLREAMLSGGEDDGGLRAAMSQADQAYNSGKWGRAIAAFLDPAGAAQRDAAAYERSRTPIEAWKTTTARRDQRAAQEASQAQKMQQLAQQMRMAEMRDAAAQRGLSLREMQADPGSEWNQRRRGESEADWRARQQYAEELRRGGVVHDAPFKNRNAALSSGSPASLRAIDARPVMPGAYRGVETPADAMAEAVLQQFEIDQEPVPRHIEAMVNQLRNPNLDSQERTALRLALQGAVDTHRARTDEGAARIGAARRTENIPQTIAQINKVRELIGQSGDIPGMSRGEKLGRAVLGDTLGQALTSAEGRRVQNQVDLLKDQLKRLQSGMATTAREDVLFDRVLGTDFFASPDDFRASLQDLQDVLADRDAAIIQEAGPQAARVFSQRRPGAVDAAPRMQPGTNTPTNARTVVKRQRNTATGQIRVVYSDGTSEIVDGP